MKTKCTTNSGETITSLPYKIIFGNVCDNDGVNWGMLLKSPAPESTDTVAYTGGWSDPISLKISNHPTKCPVTCALAT